MLVTTLLQLQELNKKVSESFALHHISFQQQQGERIAIAGASGSGKSTLLRIIAGLDTWDNGKVLFQGQPIKGPQQRLIPGEPHIAYLSQHYELRNHYRMEELLEYANQLPQAEAEKIFVACNIQHLLKRKTDQLSGGEKQRIALARLLLSTPTLLILDEPFSNLDLIHKAALKQVIAEVSRVLQLTIIIASHDPLDILPWADRILIMEEGKMVQQAAPEQLYFQPSSLYTAALLGAYNILMTPTAIAMGLSNREPQLKALIRPELLQITARKNGGCNGNITHIAFNGFGYSIKIATPHQTLTVHTIQSHFKINQEVGITFKNNAEPAWIA
jgi:ABC-type Fe3+/spermidine/putrescine transport system ATPase subunit